MKYRSSPDPVSSIQLRKAVGHRFHPTHEQLISHYLVLKVRGSKVKDLQLIAEVKLCKHEPWDLPDMSVIESDNEEWYFFCPIDKYFNSQSRSNRKTKAGYWKPTSKKIPILAKGTKKEIGIRKTLVFYEKAGPKQKAVRTGWIITEYEITNSGLSDKGGYFLCKLKKKSVDKTKKGEQNHHVASVADLAAEHSAASAFENQNPSEISVNSAPDGSELSNHQGSDFQNQHSNELLTNSAHEVILEVYLNLPMDSDFENQNSNELKQAHEVIGSSHYLASDSEIQISNDHMPDSVCDIISGLDLHINSDFDNQDSEKLTVDSAFNWSKCLIDCGNQCPNELKVDSAYNGSQSQFMAFGFENQYPNDPRVNSACNGNKCHYSAFDYGNQYPNKLKVDSAYDGSKSQSMAFGSGNQYPNELIANSACNGSKGHYMAFDYGNQYPNNLTTESDYSGSKSQFMTFDSENQNSFKIVATSSYENQLVNPICESCPSQYCSSDKSETSSMASCSENQNLDKEIDLSGFNCSYLTFPLDFANQNPCKETDMSTKGEDSTAWFPENNVADAASPELIISEILAEVAENFETTEQS